MPNAGLTRTKLGMLKAHLGHVGVVRTFGLPTCLAHPSLSSHHTADLMKAHCPYSLRPIYLWHELCVCLFFKTSTLAKQPGRADRGSLLGRGVDRHTFLPQTK
jgi:hypothetical protein